MTTELDELTARVDALEKVTGIEFANPTPETDFEKWAREGTELWCVDRIFKRNGELPEIHCGKLVFKYGQMAYYYSFECVNGNFGVESWAKKIYIITPDRAIAEAKLRELQWAKWAEDGTELYCVVIAYEKPKLFNLKMFFHKGEIVATRCKLKENEVSFVWSIESMNFAMNNSETANYNITYLGLDREYAERVLGELQVSKKLDDGEREMRDFLADVESDNEPKCNVSQETIDCVLRYYGRYPNCSEKPNTSTRPEPGGDKSMGDAVSGMGRDNESDSWIEFWHIGGIVGRVEDYEYFQHDEHTQRYTPDGEYPIEALCEAGNKIGVVIGASIQSLITTVCGGVIAERIKTRRLAELKGADEKRLTDNVELVIILTVDMLKKLKIRIPERD